MENTTLDILRHQAILSKFRLTFSNTEVEYWQYKKGFLAHAREISKNVHSENNEEIVEPKARRSDNLVVLRNNVRRLVNCNHDRYGYEPTFLTFTYKENQNDIAQAWKDWHVFMRKMRLRYGTLHALSVMEFQKRGAVHFHCIFFNLSPVIEFTERKSRVIAGLWGHGFVDIERVRSARNVGAYVCKYMNKSADDVRLRGKKFYSTTRNLFKPMTLTGEFARSKFYDIIFAGRLHLLAESEYEYGGEPVKYQNFKRIKNKE